MATGPYLLYGAGDAVNARFEAVGGAVLHADTACVVGAGDLGVVVDRIVNHESHLATDALVE